MRVREFFFVLPLLLALAGTPGAVEAPDPTPTPADTSGSVTESLRASSTFPCPDSVPTDSAREAAWLTTLGRLARQATSEDQDSTLRIDAAHPRYELLGWLLESRLRIPPSPKGLMEVHLESPPLHSLGLDPTSLGTAFQADLDGDGEPEQVTAGPDTRVRVHRGDHLIAQSAPLGFLEVRTLPGPRGLLEMVRLTRALAVEAGEPDGAGWARLKVRLLHSEALGGRCAGRIEEVREIRLALTPPETVPSIELTVPQDGQARVPLRGLVRAPQGLAEVQVHLNQTELWRSPPALKGQELKLDLVLDLRSGLNPARLAVTDQAGLKAERPLVLSGPARRVPGQGLAVVVGLSEASNDTSSVAAALTKVGFTVRSHLGPQATRKAILEALEDLVRQARPDDRAVLYYAGAIRLEGESQALATAEEGRLTAAELGEWARRLPGTRLLVVLDTRTPSAGPADERWAGRSALLAQLAGPDRLLLAAGDASTGQGLTQAFLQAMQWEKDPFAAARRAYPQAVQEAAGQAGDPTWPLMRED